MWLLSWCYTLPAHQPTETAMNTTTNNTTNNTITHIADRRHSERQAQPGGDRLSTQYRERDFGIGYGTRSEIGRAHVCTPVTNAHPVYRLLLAKNNATKQ